MKKNWNERQNLLSCQDWQPELLFPFHSTSKPFLQCTWGTRSGRKPSPASVTPRVSSWLSWDGSSCLRKYHHHGASFYETPEYGEFDEAVPPLGDCPFGEFCGHLYRRPLSLVAGFAQPGITEALSELSAHIMSVGAIDNIYRGIPAGILIAAIVWMIPMSRGFSFSPSSLLPTSSLSVGFPMLLSVPVKRRMMCLWETRQLRIISLNSSFLQA